MDSQFKTIWRELQEMLEIHSNNVLAWEHTCLLRCEMGDERGDRGTRPNEKPQDIIYL